MITEEELATQAGLNFHKALRYATTIPLSGATGRAWQDVQEIDPRVWEDICRTVAHALLVFLDSKGVVQKTKYGQGRNFWDCQRLPGVER
jgi:hypothetical protein